MSEYCKIHKFEKLERHTDIPIFDEYGQMIFDNDGVPVMDDFVEYYCPYCEEDEEFYKSENGTESEK